ECPRCHDANADGARFCGECGASLTRDVTCAGCGQANPVGQKFCNGCGQGLGASAPAATRDPRAYTPNHLAEKILTSRAALEGERKQVTVLFADVKGSMELAEQLDPEVFHRVMDRFFQLLVEGVHRFEGTVVQFTGDGIMALFGAPIAHEDHAQRACWTALHLRDVLRRYADQLRVSNGLNLSVRTGLNSGEVVVGKIGDDLRMDYTALGHTVGLAQRMEQLAEAGRIYLAGPTAASVASLFRLREVGPLVVKGASEPVRVFELEGPGAHRTRLDVARARGFTRFVGRNRELEVLDAALERAAVGQRQVVGIVAEAGVGKSRVCYEFAERCRARGIRVVEGHGVPHGRAVPLLPWLEVFRSTYRISEQDDDETARDKIAGRMLRLDPALGDALPVMFEFLGVADPKRPAPRMSPEALQHQLVLLAKRISQARARQHELGIYVFEDLHWFDAASDGFLAAVCEAVHGTNSLIVCTFRPEYHGPWMEKSYYQQIALLPLGPEALDDLLRDLLGDDPSLANLPIRIRERTAGNPFFAEEVVQALIEAGSLVGTKGAYRLAQPVEYLTIPPTVQAVLAARIDRLPAREKAVLQTAAVIARELREPVLRQVVDLPEGELAAALQALVASEFLYEVALYPEVEYAFEHPLTQEAAYRSQLAERRAQVHGRVARAIEALYPDKLDERAALLAYHWEGAGEAHAAAQWHRRAAEWVGARDRGEMSRHWQRVCALLDAVPESAETLATGILARTRLLGNGAFLGQADDEAAALFAEGMTLASRLDGPAPRIVLLVAYGLSRLSSGAVDEALTHLTESFRLADQSGNTFLQFVARVGLASALAFAGQLREAVAVSDDAERLCEGNPEVGADPGLSPYEMVLSYRAIALAWLGRLGEAAARDL
ncbi:MAG TPA: adenylate/guanylate cyclase domain-containing protein, partial [Gaiellaceae bacterium]|nr:adenylate/guanylate cyclase domain-containing protein [Gaiellaceae bacterium]